MRALLLLLAASLALPACGPAGGPPATEDAELSGDLTVFAAASLTDVLTELDGLLTTDHPGLRLVANLAGSQQLAAQILEGAPADVFAAASPEPLARVAEAGLVEGDQTTFATNRLEIVVEAGNPRGVEGLADLADDDLVLVLASPEVPAGRYAEQALDRAGVAVAPDSLEVDVRAVLAKVRLGEADAGIVYRTDVAAAGGDVGGVRIPDAHDVPADYPVAVLADAPNPAAARAFVELLMSERGREVLARAGFGVP